MKYDTSKVDDLIDSRTPHGVRGLKFRWLFLHGLEIPSHPARGTWIEIDAI